MNPDDPGTRLVMLFRTAHIWPRERAVLLKMLAEPNVTLDWAAGSHDAYFENEPVSMNVVYRLMRRVWISVVYKSNTEDYISYALNEDGRAVAEKLKQEAG